MSKYILTLCLVVAYYLICSITIVAKDKSITIGTPSALPRDTIAIEYKCVHGDRWGIYFDCGYRKWIHRLYNHPRKAGEHKEVVCAVNASNSKKGCEKTCE